MHFTTNFMKIIKSIIIICLLSIFFSKTCYNPENVKKKELYNYQDFKDNVIPAINIIKKDDLINENVMSTLNNYSSLKTMIKEANIQIPVENKFIPQGITLVRGHYLITGYYDSHKKSKCYVIDALGDIVNIVELDTDSHVGSISYDEKRQLLWIPDNDGVLNAYTVSDFFTKQNVKAKYKFNYISEELIDFQNSSKKLIAYLCVDGDYLYIGNFFINSECTVKKYKITSNDKKIDLKYIDKFIVPKKTQSLDFVEYNHKKYLLISQSYGRSFSSFLYVYEYEEKRKNYVGAELKKIKTPPLMEQISVNDSLLYLLFESNASKYWNCKERIEFIMSLNVNDLLN